jgi:acylphosphatase
MAERARVTVIVRGVVQGVGYRYYVMRLAREYRLGGYVRNREDGTVEVEAEGDTHVLDSFIEDLRTGPSAARVTDLDIETSSTEKGYSDFNLRF